MLMMMNWIRLMVANIVNVEVVPFADLYVKNVSQILALIRIQNQVQVPIRNQNQVQNLITRNQRNAISITAVRDQTVKENQAIQVIQVTVIQAIQAIQAIPIAQ